MFSNFFCWSKFSVLFQLVFRLTSADISWRVLNTSSSKNGLCKILFWLQMDFNVRFKWFLLALRYFFGKSLRLWISFKLLYSSYKINSNSIYFNLILGPTKSILKKTLIDQFLFTPPLLCLFFSIMAAAEVATWANVKNEITTKLPKVCSVFFLFGFKYIIM